MCIDVIFFGKLYCHAHFAYRHLTMYSNKILFYSHIIFFVSHELFFSTKMLSYAMRLFLISDKRFKLLLMCTQATVFYVI